MTTIEKKLTDPYFKGKVMELLPLLSGCDYDEIDNILTAARFLLKKNAIFNLPDSEVSIKGYLSEISAKA